MLSTNSETSLFAITNFLIDSIIAVAPVVEPVISLTTKLVVSPTVATALKTFCIPFVRLIHATFVF